MKKMNKTLIERWGGLGALAGLEGQVNQQPVSNYIEEETEEARTYRKKVKEFQELKEKLCLRK